MILATCQAGLSGEGPSEVGCVWFFGNGSGTKALKSVPSVCVCVQGTEARPWGQENQQQAWARHIIPGSFYLQPWAVCNVEKDALSLKGQMREGDDLGKSA